MPPAVTSKKITSSRIGPGLKVYRFKSAGPGEDPGAADDGLVNVNGRRRVSPEPRRAAGS